jgi:AraC family transcriptional regulator of adaptative response/methylated-DNA-[protein]-cysteine methyltransferase
MERAYQRSDASYDGLFYLGVRTTGVFCRPSCPARKPKPGNVEFFAATDEARRAGYRPCLRCRPADDNGTPSWVARVLARVDHRPLARIRGDDLRAMGVEPARLRRYFASRYGLTFQAYCRARRLACAYDSLRQGGSVDDAVFETGFSSHSGFREAFQRIFGKTPGRAGESTFVRITWLDTPLGVMVAGATDGGLCLLEFTDRRALDQQLARLRRRLRAVLLPGSHPHLRTLRHEIAEYFAGVRRTFTVPVATMGTPFETRVWKALEEIPYGETRSYADIARRIGQPQAVRAVGLANGRNVVAIVIPCHRVVNASGALGGYGGGLWRKRRLLHLENQRPPATNRQPPATND